MWKKFGKDSVTNILFTFYLAKSIQDRSIDQEQENNYARPNNNKEDLLPEHLHDHTYIPPFNQIAQFTPTNNMQTTLDGQQQTEGYAQK